MRFRRTRKSSAEAMSSRSKGASRIEEAMGVTATERNDEFSESLRQWASRRAKEPTAVVEPEGFPWVIVPPSERSVRRDEKEMLDQSGHR
jgi:hypothetical protein